MSVPHLRVFSASQDPITDPHEVSENITVETTTVNLRDIVPLLVDAARTNRVWLNDFADETVAISSDLYEVLLTYQRIAQQDQRAG